MKNLLSSLSSVEVKRFSVVLFTVSAILVSLVGISLTSYQTADAQTIDVLSLVEVNGDSGHDQWDTESTLDKYGYVLAYVDGSDDWDGSNYEDDHEEEEHEYDNDEDSNDADSEDEEDNGYGDDEGDYNDEEDETENESDQDGSDDDEDNCHVVSEEDEADVDEYGGGDACDDTTNDDTDGDGINNSDDNCPECINPEQEDADDDGIGDDCDETPHGDHNHDDDDENGNNSGEERIYQEITIVKKVVGDNVPSEWSFDFTSDFHDFTLTESTYGYKHIEGELAIGEHAITEESLPAGWTLSGIVCSEGTDFNVNGSTVTISLSKGDIVTCTFTNTFTESEVDTDEDGITDDDDNCPAVANADQTDTDGDGRGNVCDDTPNGSGGSSGGSSSSTSSSGGSSSGGVARYTISAFAGFDGTISPSGVISVLPGESQTFDIVPNPGYQIANVIVDGVFVGPVSSSTFSNIQGNHLITALFSKVPAPLPQGGQPTGQGGTGGIVPPGGEPWSEAPPTDGTETSPEDLGAQPAAVVGGGIGQLLNWLSSNWLWVIILLLILGAAYYYYNQWQKNKIVDQSQPSQTQPSQTQPSQTQY